LGLIELTQDAVTLALFALPLALLVPFVLM